MASSSALPSMLPYQEGMPPAVYNPAQIPVGEEAPGLTAADFWRILKQRKLTVLITFLTLYLLIGVATFVVWRWFAAYPASGVLELQPPQDPTKVTQDMARPEEMRLLLETEAQKIQQPALFQEVLSLKDIQDTAFFKWYDSFEECVDDMLELVSVAPRPDSRLITVSLATQKKEEAVKIVDAIITRYLGRYTSSEKDSKQKVLDDFKTSRENLSTQLARKQEELLQFRGQTDVPALPMAGSVELVELQKLTEDLNLLRAQKRSLEMEYDVIRAVANPDFLPITAEMRLIIESDPMLRFNRQQVESLDIQIQTLLRSGRVGRGHREIAALEAQRDEFYQREIVRREELVDDLRERRTDEIKSSLQQANGLIEQLTERQVDAEGRQRDMDDAIVQYQQKMLEREQLQRRLEEIEKKVAEAELAVASAPRRPSLAVWQRPREAIWPSRPNLVLFLGGGFVLSLLGAIGLAFLREISDTAVRTPRDVVRLSGGHLPVLGSIPLIDDEQADVDEIELATRRAPQSLVAESFRQVRAGLMFSGPAESQRVVLLCSPGPADGATACSINLAITFAQSNQRVLLIDCNFRRPAIRAAFRNTRSEGLSNVLIGQKKLADVISTTELPNLDVVTTGPMPPTPAELLGSTLMADAIKDAAQNYDRVILDGPPALLVSDSLVLATLVDGVIIVARAVSNSKGELKRCREQLVRVGGRVVGCILNGVHVRAGGYLRQQYREFYEYQSDETAPQELLGAGAAGSDDEKPPAPKSKDEDD